MLISSHSYASDKTKPVDLSKHGKYQCVDTVSSQIHKGRVVKILPYASIITIGPGWEGRTQLKIESNDGRTGHLAWFHPKPHKEFILVKGKQGDTFYMEKDGEKLVYNMYYKLDSMPQQTQVIRQGTCILFPF